MSLPRQNPDAPLDALQIAHLQSWVGNRETREDVITAAPVRALSATLDYPGTELAQCLPLPPLWHWLYFLPCPRQSDLNNDGHGRLGSFLPPVPLPRRMWAAGRVEWQAGNPLRVGDRVQRTSVVEAVTHKLGRGGELVFVTVSHTLANETGLSLRETQDLVYRHAAQPGEQPAPGSRAPTEATWRETRLAEPTLLFRYSALTFNSHRIHYDREYAQAVEGYPALVVQGPLLATLLANLAARKLPDARFESFSFKALRPLFDGASFGLAGESTVAGATLWAHDPQGGLNMLASLERAADIAGDMP